MRLITSNNNRTLESRAVGTKGFPLEESLCRGMVGAGWVGGSDKSPWGSGELSSPAAKMDSPGQAGLTPGMLGSAQGEASRDGGE